MSDTNDPLAEQVAELVKAVEEIAVGLFGPTRTRLQGGGRDRARGALDRLEKVESDALEALDVGKKAADVGERAYLMIEGLDKARKNGGIPARLRVDLRDRNTQKILGWIALLGTFITAAGGVIGALIGAGVTP